MDHLDETGSYLWLSSDPGKKFYCQQSAIPGLCKVYRHIGWTDCRLNHVCYAHQSAVVFSRVVLLYYVDRLVASVF